MPPSSRGTAIIALFSMYSCSWWPTRYVASMISSPASANAASTSPLTSSWWAKTVVDSSGSKTGGSGSVRSVHPLAGLAERLAVRRREQRDGLRLVPDLPADRDEDRLVVRDAHDDVPARDVVRGDDGDPRPVEGRVELDREQARVRHGRADRGAVPGAGEDEVVGVQRLPGELGRTLAARREGDGDPRTGAVDRVAGVWIVKGMGPPWSSRKGAVPRPGVSSERPRRGPTASPSRWHTRRARRPCW